MKTTELYRTKLMYGCYSRVAASLGLGRAHVWRVVNGERNSPRVSAAMSAELRRVERLVRKFEAKQPGRADRCVANVDAKGKPAPRLTPELTAVRQTGGAA